MQGSRNRLQIASGLLSLRESVCERSKVYKHFINFTHLILTTPVQFKILTMIALALQLSCAVRVFAVNRFRIISLMAIMVPRQTLDLHSAASLRMAVRLLPRKFSDMLSRKIFSNNLLQLIQILQPLLNWTLKNAFQLFIVRLLWILLLALPLGTFPP